MAFRVSMSAGTGMCLLILACGAGDADRPPGHSVLDSAGVQIVESTAPAWEPGTEWRVSAEPVLTIGVLDGPPEYQLYQVRGALRLGDGTVVVTNVGTSEIRFYDAEGRFVRAVGGEGAGPGEFGRLAGMYRYGADSLLIFDFGNARFQVFDRSGTYARTFRLQQIAGVPLPIGVLASGHVLANWLVSDGQQREGVSRPVRQYALYGGLGELVDTLFRGLGTEFYSVAAGPQSTVSVSMPFAHRAYVALRGDTLLYGASERYEIEQRARDGTLQRIVRRDLPNRRVTDAIIVEREARARERRAARGATGPSPFDDLAYPAEMPAHGTLLTDADGNLWIQYYRYGEEPVRFAVYDPAGRWLGDVDPPTGLRFTDVGSDYVLGIWRDELEVEQVRVHALLKTPRP
jgi:hypothetical protein